MVYRKTLPRFDKIVALEKLIDKYPVTVYKISEIAQKYNFNNSMHDFIKLFPSDGVFENSDDFLTRFEELVIIIQEERKAQSEISRSP